MCHVLLAGRKICRESEKFRGFVSLHGNICLLYYSFCCTTSGDFLLYYQNQNASLIDWLAQSCCYAWKAVERCGKVFACSVNNGNDERMTFPTPNALFITKNWLTHDWMGMRRRSELNWFILITLFSLVFELCTYFFSCQSRI